MYEINAVIHVLSTGRLVCVAVCCGVLQCVAVCCSLLQCVAVRCNVMQCVAVCCNVLQCVAVCCSVLQCVAVCCSVLQCAAVWQDPTLSTGCIGIYRRGDVCVCAFVWERNGLHRVGICAVCCNVLQCVAVWCSVLQCVAVRCTTLGGGVLVLFCSCRTELFLVSLEVVLLWYGEDA